MEDSESVSEASPTSGDAEGEGSGAVAVTDLVDVSVEYADFVDAVWDWVDEVSGVGPEV